MIPNVQAVRIATLAISPPLFPVNFFAVKANGFGTAFNRAKINVGMNDRDLHFHDLRGTAATRFYIAGLSNRVIAEILAWSEDQVERIIRRYVARGAATKAAIQQLNEARKRT
jgi:integrase